jgi:hypothetical protein
MVKMQSGDLKINFPMLFVVLMSFCGLFTTLGIGSYILRVIYYGQLSSQLFKCVFGFCVILIISWFLLKILFYSVTATEKGLITANIGKLSKFFQWNEIVEVRRPRFGMPVDASYVISKNKGKLLLIRSMKNYKELIQMIKDRAPNLERCQS